MKKDSEANDQPSRRRFTKSIAAAFVSAPLASSLSCGSKSTEPNTLRGAEPPVIITDGSFVIEIDEELERAGEGGIGPDGKNRRRYKRREDGGDEKHISCIVVRRKSDGRALFCQTFKKGECEIEIHWAADACRSDQGADCSDA